MSNESYWNSDEWYDEQYRKDLEAQLKSITSYYLEKAGVPADLANNNILKNVPPPTYKNLFTLEDEQFLRDCGIKV